ncbi:MAG: hypothetical protein WCG98_07675 [bacterium]
MRIMIGKRINRIGMNGKVDISKRDNPRLVKICHPKTINPAKVPEIMTNIYSLLIFI